MDMKVWDLYFATVVGMYLHPRQPRDIDLEHCAYVADHMMDLRTAREVKENEDV